MPTNGFSIKPLKQVKLLAGEQKATEQNCSRAFLCLLLNAQHPLEGAQKQVASKKHGYRPVPATHSLGDHEPFSHELPLNPAESMVACCKVEPFGT